jgi:hypothetical protein
MPHVFGPRQLVDDAPRPLVVLDPDAPCSCERATSEILLVEDDDGAIEMVEVLVIGTGRRRRVLAAPGATPPRGRALLVSPRPCDVDEAAQTGMFLRVSLRGPVRGPWTPLVRH